MGIRIRHEEMESIFRGLLHALGALEDPSDISPTLALQMKYRKDEQAYAMVKALLVKLPEVIKEQALSGQAGPGKPFDITPLAAYLVEEFGRDGLNLFFEFFGL